MTDLQEKAMRMALEFVVFSSAKDRAWFTEKEFKVVAALHQALAQEQEPVAYKEECWACGGEECICATKVPGYYESKIKEAVLAEREACAKVCDAEATIEGIAQKCAAAIRARSDK